MILSVGKSGCWLKCDECGRIFHRPISKMHRYDDFCSRNCYDFHQIKEYWDRPKTVWNIIRKRYNRDFYKYIQEHPEELDEFKGYLMPGMLAKAERLIAEEKAEEIRIFPTPAPQWLTLWEDLQRVDEIKR